MTYNYLFNKAEIIEKFCINKDKPILKCDGKCHLKDQLELSEAGSEESPINPLNLEENIEILANLNSSPISIKCTCNVSSLHWQIYDERLLDGHHVIFSPPPQA